MNIWTSEVRQTAWLSTPALKIFFVRFDTRNTPPGDSMNCEYADDIALVTEEVICQCELSVPNCLCRGRCSWAWPSKKWFHISVPLLKPSFVTISTHCDVRSDAQITWFISTMADGLPGSGHFQRVSPANVMQMIPFRSRNMGR